MDPGVREGAELSGDLGRVGRILIFVRLFPEWSGMAGEGLARVIWESGEQKSKTSQGRATNRPIAELSSCGRVTD